MPIDTKQLSQVFLSDSFNAWREKYNELVVAFNGLPAATTGVIDRLGGTIDGDATSATLAPSVPEGSGYPTVGRLWMTYAEAGIGIGDFLGTDQPLTLKGEIEVLRESANASIHIVSGGADKHAILSLNNYSTGGHSYISANGLSAGGNGELLANSLGVLVAAGTGIKFKNGLTIANSSGFYAYAGQGYRLMTVAGDVVTDVFTIANSSGVFAQSEKGFQLGTSNAFVANSRAIYANSITLSKTTGANTSGQLHIKKASAGGADAPIAIAPGNPHLTTTDYPTGFEDHAASVPRGTTVLSVHLGPASPYSNVVGFGTAHGGGGISTDIYGLTRIRLFAGGSITAADTQRKHTLQTLRLSVNTSFTHTRPSVLIGTSTGSDEPADESAHIRIYHGGFKANSTTVESGSSIGFRTTDGVFVANTETVRTNSVSVVRSTTANSSGQIRLTTESKLESDLRGAGAPLYFDLQGPSSDARSNRTHPPKGTNRIQLFTRDADSGAQPYWSNTAGIGTAYGDGYLNVQYYAPASHEFYLFPAHASSDAVLDPWESGTQNKIAMLLGPSPDTDYGVLGAPRLLVPHALIAGSGAADSDLGTLKANTTSLYIKKATGISIEDHGTPFKIISQYGTYAYSDTGFRLFGAGDGFDRVANSTGTYAKKNHGFKLLDGDALHRVVANSAGVYAPGTGTNAGFTTDSRSFFANDSAVMTGSSVGFRLNDGSFVANSQGVYGTVLSFSSSQEVGTAGYTITGGSFIANSESVSANSIILTKRDTSNASGTLTLGRTITGLATSFQSGQLAPIAIRHAGGDDPTGPSPQGTNRISMYGSTEGDTSSWANSVGIGFAVGPAGLGMGHLQFFAPTDHVFFSNRTGSAGDEWTASTPRLRVNSFGVFARSANGFQLDDSSFIANSIAITTPSRVSIVGSGAASAGYAPIYIQKSYVNNPTLYPTGTDRLSLTGSAANLVGFGIAGTSGYLTLDAYSRNDFRFFTTGGLDATPSHLRLSVNSTTVMIPTNFSGSVMPESVEDPTVGFSVGPINSFYTFVSNGSFTRAGGNRGFAFCSETDSPGLLMWPDDARYRSIANTYLTGSNPSLWASAKSSAGFKFMDNVNARSVNLANSSGVFTIDDKPFQTSDGFFRASSENITITTNQTRGSADQAEFFANSSTVRSGAVFGIPTTSTDFSGRRAPFVVQSMTGQQGLGGATPVGGDPSGVNRISFQGPHSQPLVANSIGIGVDWSVAGAGGNFSVQHYTLNDTNFFTRPFGSTSSWGTDSNPWTNDHKRLSINAIAMHSRTNVIATGALTLTDGQSTGTAPPRSSFLANTSGMYHAKRMVVGLNEATGLDVLRSSVDSVTESGHKAPIFIAQGDLGTSIGAIRPPCGTNKISIWNATTSGDAWANAVGIGTSWSSGEVGMDLYAGADVRVFTSSTSGAPGYWSLDTEPGAMRLSVNAMAVDAKTNVIAKGALSVVPGAGGASGPDNAVFVANASGAFSKPEWGLASAVLPIVANSVIGNSTTTETTAGRGSSNGSITIAGNIKFWFDTRSFSPSNQTINLGPGDGTEAGGLNEFRKVWTVVSSSARGSASAADDAIILDDQVSIRYVCASPGSRDATLWVIGEAL